MDLSQGAPLVIFALALLIDGLLGEYPPPLHPVVWLGKIIDLQLRLAPRAGWWRQFAFGTLLALCTVTASVALAWFTLTLTAPWPWLEIAVGALLLKAAFALRELGQAALRVVAPLEKGDVGSARLALRALCSRDPSALGPEALTAATVQSLAENASDSFVAPLFYYLLLGVPGAFGYRAINTLDAMVGYRGRYEALGKFSARLDDVANLLPARLTAGLLLLAGALTGRPVAHAWRIARRDGAKTPSPNGGRPMAVMAGLLGVRLEKPGVYALGEPLRPLEPGCVREAWRLVVGVGVLLAGLVVAGLLLRSEIATSEKGVRSRVETSPPARCASSGAVARFRAPNETITTSTWPNGSARASCALTASRSTSSSGGDT